MERIFSGMCGNGNEPLLEQFYGWGRIYAPVQHYTRPWCSVSPGFGLNNTSYCLPWNDSLSIALCFVVSRTTIYHDVCICNVFKMEIERDQKSNVCLETVLHWEFLRRFVSILSVFPDLIMERKWYLSGNCAKFIFSEKLKFGFCQLDLLIGLKYCNKLTQKWLDNKVAFSKLTVLYELTSFTLCISIRLNKRSRIQFFINSFQ